MIDLHEIKERHCDGIYVSGFEFLEVINLAIAAESKLADTEKALKGEIVLCDSYRAQCADLEKQVRYLRCYGNKDCTAMADEAIENNSLDDQYSKPAEAVQAAPSRDDIIQCIFSVGNMSEGILADAIIDLYKSNSAVRGLKY